MTGGTERNRAALQLYGRTRTVYWGGLHDPSLGHVARLFLGGASALPAFPRDGSTCAHARATEEPIDEKPARGLREERLSIGEGMRPPLWVPMGK
jgi:hypothetical protein